MSYFLFGTFDALVEQRKIDKLKISGKEKGIFIWFNEEITCYSEIQRMLKEQKSNGKIAFSITSMNQPHNSNDVLFPFDKFSSEELFSDKSRTCFKKISESNLNTLFEYLYEMTTLLEPKNFEMFVVEGYDDSFQRKEMDLSQIRNEMLEQIVKTVAIESCIYCVSVKR